MAAVWGVAALGGLASGCDGREIRSDEDLIFFPSQTYWSEDGETATAPIHAWVFERETGSVWRRETMDLLYRQLEIEPETGEEERFRNIARMFLVDNERGKELLLTLAGGEHRLGPTEASGHLRATLSLDRSFLDRLAAEGVNVNDWIPFEASARDGRTFAGRVQWLDPEGLMVVSDVDDTIKDSNVRDRKELLANTFLRPFRAIDGMAEAYERWRQEFDAAFCYVTASPWQLYPPLEEFRQAAGYPPGAWFMKSVRLKDSTFLALFADPEQYKIETIEAVLRRYPGRRFVLVGDSGEKDPEAYGELARRHPAQVEHVFIRNVTGEGEDAQRYRQALRDLPRESWTVFDDPGVLHQWMPAGSAGPDQP